MVSNYYKGNKDIANLIVAMIGDVNDSGDEFSIIETMRFVYDIVEGYFGLDNGRAKSWKSWKRKGLALVILDKRLKQLRLLVSHRDAEYFSQVLDSMDYPVMIDSRNKYGVRFKIKLPDLLFSYDLDNLDLLVKNCFNSFNHSSK